MLFEIILKIITLKKIFDKIQIFQKNNFSKFVAKTVLKFIGQDLIAQVVITKFYQEWVQYVQIVNIQLDISMERKEERGMEDFLQIGRAHV